MRQCIIYCLLITSSISFAEEYTHDKLTLNQAVVNVLENSPQLKAADFEAKAAAARIRTSQQSTAFRTSVELENFGGDGRNNGSDNLESTLSLSKVLELGGKAKLRGELSRSKAMLLRNELDSKRLDLLADTTKRFIHIVTDQERLIIARDTFALAKHTLEVVEQRLAAGKSPDAELRRATIVLARKELELDHAEHELLTSRFKLATLWGETQINFTTAEADLFDINPLPSFESLISLIDQNPDLIRYVTEKRLADARIQLAKSERQSDIEFSGGIKHFNATGDTGFLLSLNIPLGSSSRATPKIEEAEMLSLSDPHLLKQRKLLLHVTLFEIYQEIKHAVDSVSTLRETIIPQAKKALKDYETGYLAGRYSFLELTEAQRILLDSRLEAVMAATDYHRYFIEIDRLTGAGLSIGENP